MGLPYLEVGVGIFAFILLLWILKIVFKVQQINPLLGLGGIYVFFYFLAEKLSNSVPDSWKVKQINNLWELDGSLGFLLRLNQPKLSAYELASTTFRLCLIGYFIYVFAFKKGSWEKIKRPGHRKNQGPML